MNTPGIDALSGAWARIVEEGVLPSMYFPLAAFSRTAVASETILASTGLPAEAADAVCPKAEAASNGKTRRMEMRMAFSSKAR